MDVVLAQVRDFADKAHGNQMRKYTPERYIVHPVRVMEMCRPYNASLPVLASALLHDVLEDTPVTHEQLYHFLQGIMNTDDATYTLHLVKELTDIYTKEKFPQWNRKKRKRNEARRMSKTSPEAQTIKYADIIDNCTEIAKDDPEFAPRFLMECYLLLQSIPKGHPELYIKARQVVEANLDAVS